MESRLLNVIGCGKVGRTLASLWEQARAFSLGSVCNRSRGSAESALSFIGSGHACNSIGEMSPASVWMITTSDAEIPLACQELAQTGLLREGDLVFHCSGALSSELLFSAAERGALTASLHPIRSFAEPSLAAANFAGTVCAVEGDDVATKILEEMVAGIGGVPFRLSAASKMLCHSGHVFASNYLVAVVDVAERLYRAAGVPDDIIQQLLPVIVQSSVDNIKSLGTQRALTGPAVRGEAELIQTQVDALEAFDPRYAELYSALGRHAATIAEERGTVGPQAIMALRRVFGG